MGRRDDEMVRWQGGWTVGRLDGWAARRRDGNPKTVRERDGKTVRWRDDETVRRQDGGAARRRDGERARRLDGETARRKGKRKDRGNQCGDSWGRRLNALGVHPRAGVCGGDQSRNEWNLRRCLASAKLRARWSLATAVGLGL